MRVTAKTAGSGDEASPGGRKGLLPGVPSVAGVYRIVEFGAFFAGLQAGSVAVISDAATDTTVQSYESTWGLIGIRAAVAYPVMKRGRLAAAVYVHSLGPRRWSDVIPL